MKKVAFHMRKVVAAVTKNQIAVQEAAVAEDVVVAADQIGGLLEDSVKG